jgi:FMN reductase
MTTRTLAVVSAGHGTPSSTRLLADRLAAATSEALRERGDEVAVEVVELREHAHDLGSTLLTGFAPPALAGAIDTVTRADAVIAVTPVFTASYSGLFETLFDVLDPKALLGVPVLIAATAGSPRTRWSSSTRCARSSATCAPPSSRPPSSPRPRTGAPGTAS